MCHRRAPVPEPAGGQAGFSLLEVLIATVILSLTLAIILQGQAGGLATQAADASRLQATWVAEQVLLDSGQPGKLQPGRWRGQQGAFRYEVEAIPQYRLPLSHLGRVVACYVLTVTVSWQEKGRPKSLVVYTLRTRQEKS